MVKDSEDFVEIFTLYRVSKHLSDEQETALAEKSVKISKNSQSVNHLITIFENLSDEEFELDTSFQKYMNLKSLFYWDNLLPEQRMEFMRDLLKDFIQNGLYGRSKEKTKLILLFDLTPLGYGISLIQTTITGKGIKLVKTKNGEILQADERFLDEDNIYRFIYFYKKDNGGCQDKHSQ